MKSSYDHKIPVAKRGTKRGITWLTPGEFHHSETEYRVLKIKSFVDKLHVAKSVKEVELILRAFDGQTLVRFNKDIYTGVFWNACCVSDSEFDILSDTDISGYAVDPHVIVIMLFDAFSQVRQQPEDQVMLSYQVALKLFNMTFSEPKKVLKAAINRLEQMELVSTLTSTRNNFLIYPKK